MNYFDVIPHEVFCKIAQQCVLDIAKVSKHIRSLVIQYDVFAFSPEYEILTINRIPTFGAPVSILRSVTMQATSGQSVLPLLPLAQILLSDSKAFRIPAVNLAFWIGNIKKTHVKNEAARLLMRGLRFFSAQIAEKQKNRPKKRRKTANGEIADEQTSPKLLASYLNTHGITAPNAVEQFVMLMVLEMTPLLFKILKDIWDEAIEIPTVAMSLLKRASRKLTVLKLFIKPTIRSLLAKGIPIPFGELHFLSKQYPIAKRIAVIVVREVIASRTDANYPLLLSYLILQNNTYAVQLVLQAFNQYAQALLTATEHLSPLFNSNQWGGYGSLVLQAVRYENLAMARLLVQFGAICNYDRMLEFLKQREATPSQVSCVLQFLSEWLKATSNIDLANEQTFLSTVFLPLLRSVKMGTMDTGEVCKWKLILDHVNALKLVIAQQ